MSNTQIPDTESSNSLQPAPISDTQPAPNLLSLPKEVRMGLRVSCNEFYPLIGTVVGNPKGWVTVDFGDMYAIPAKIQTDKPITLMSQIPNPPSTQTAPSTDTPSTQTPSTQTPPPTNTNTTQPSPHLPLVVSSEEGSKRVILPYMSPSPNSRSKLPGSLSPKGKAGKKQVRGEMGFQADEPVCLSSKERQLI